MKKIKLFTTIASLCLAVALMAFGVYAAANVTVTASGKVTYEVGVNVAGTLKVTGYSKSDKELDGGTAGEVAQLPIVATDMTGKGELKLNDITVAPGAVYAYYTVEFVSTNDGVNVAVTLSELTASTATWEAKISGQQVSLKYLGNAAADESFDLSFKITLAATEKA